MDLSKNRLALMRLFAGLVGRGLAARLGNRVQCVLQDPGEAEQGVEYDLCFYLDLAQAGERWALLTRRADVVGLIGVERARREGGGQEAEGLFRSLLERACSLVGVLTKSALLFQGCAVQSIDVALFRRALEGASRRLGMVQVSLRLVVGSRPIQMAVLVPGEVVEQAAGGLDAPENGDIRKMAAAYALQHRGAGSGPATESGPADATLDHLETLLEARREGEPVSEAGPSESGMPASEPEIPESSPEEVPHDQVDYGEEGGVLAYCVFNSLVDLSDRDTRFVLECPEVREMGTQGLACALSAASTELQEKVFRNLSANRRREVQEDLRWDWDTEEVRDAQVAIKEMAFMMTLRERIEPPPSIKRQFDRFYVQWHAWQNDVARAVRGKFVALTEQLDEKELALAVRQARREDLLWALQECEQALIDRFLQGISASQQKIFLEDLPYTLKRVEKRVDLRFNVIKARQAILEIGRNILERREG